MKGNIEMLELVFNLFLVKLNFYGIFIFLSLVSQNPTNKTVQSIYLPIFSFLQQKTTKLCSNRFFKRIFTNICIPKLSYILKAL
jgi:hypothetical protein